LTFLLLDLSSADEGGNMIKTTPVQNKAEITPSVVGAIPATDRQATLYFRA
jgi:hypothetical protein